MKEIICDKCGKKYKVDETKIKGASAKIKCKSCDNVLTVTKDAPAAVKRPEPDLSVSSVKPEFDSSYEQTVTLADSDELEKKKQEVLRMTGKRPEPEYDSSYEQTVSLADSDELEKKKQEVLRMAGKRPKP